MARVFLSYQKRDRELAERMAAALKAEGLSVWWDDDLTPRESWDRTIEREITAADHVLVLWTANSVESDWVRREAYFALNCEAPKLAQVRFENVDLPLAFSMTQYAELGLRWTPADPSWRRLVGWLTTHGFDDASENADASAVSRGAASVDMSSSGFGEREARGGQSAGQASARRFEFSKLLLIALGAALLAAAAFFGARAFWPSAPSAPPVHQTASGLRYTVVREGQGPHPSDSDMVRIVYTIRSADGALIDQSLQPTSILLAPGTLIPGMSEGLKLMRKGAEFEFVMKPELAYGAQGAGGTIPPNSTLNVEVTLIDYMTEAQAREQQAQMQAAAANMSPPEGQ